MRSDDEQTNPLDSNIYRNLKLLDQIEETPEVNQRQLSLKLGIALGLTNVLIRNLIQKGYLRVSKASWRRRIYSLTPDGLAHKLRLTQGYITRVLDDYQNVRQALRKQMNGLDVTEESRIAVYGTDEFAELVFLGLKELGIEEIDIYRYGDTTGTRFLGMPVHDASVIQSENYDKIVVAVLHGEEKIHQNFLEMGVPEQKVITFFAERVAE